MSADVPFRYTAENYGSRPPDQEMVVWFVNGMNNDERTIQESVAHLEVVLSKALGGSSISTEKIEKVSVTSRRNNNFTAEEFEIYSQLVEMVKENPRYSLGVAAVTLLGSYFLGAEGTGVLLRAFASSQIERIQSAAKRVGGLLFDQLEELLLSYISKDKPLPLLLIVGHSHGGMCVENFLQHVFETILEGSSLPSKINKNGISPSLLKTFAKESLIVTTFGSPTFIPDFLFEPILRGFQIVHEMDEISFKQTGKGPFSPLHRLSAEALSLSETKQEDADVSKTVITLDAKNHPTISPHSIGSYFSLCLSSLED